MAIFQVDSNQVTAAAAHANQSSLTIQAEVARMMSLLRGLEGSWVGAASASFQGLIEQWQLTQVQVEESLRAISTQLDAAAHTYSEAEAAAASMFRG